MRPLPGAGTVRHTRAMPPTISPREREVLPAVADRLTNAEIADRLHVSVRTVETRAHARRLGDTALLEAAAKQFAAFEAVAT